MKKRITTNIIALILCFIGFFALMYFVFCVVEKTADNIYGNSNTNDSFSYSDNSAGQAYYDGQWYVPDESNELILVTGVDKKEEGSEKRQNSQQADFLALLVINKEQKTYKILHINRDTITDIPQTDAFGEQYGTTKAQLALAHTYGNDEKVRSRNTVNTVEHLLYGINIDHYITLTMDAVPILNDSVGGVTLQLMDDFTQLDETLVKGAVVTLKGENALAYVRERGALEDSSNIHRMERQQQYISEFMKQTAGVDLSNKIDVVLEAGDYIVSDCTIDQLSSFAELLSECTFSGTHTLPGETVLVDGYMEYHLDEAQTQKLVLDMFYEPKENQAKSE